MSAAVECEEIFNSIFILFACYFLEMMGVIPSTIRVKRNDSINAGNPEVNAYACVFIKE